MNLKVTFFSLLHLLMLQLGESWYNYSVPYKERFTMTCPIFDDPPFMQNIYWLLPSKELVSSSYSDDIFQVSGHPAANLTIRSTTEDTFGVYMCFTVWQNQTLSMAAVGVNVEVTLWHIKYKSMVIRGIIAGACFFAGLTVYCLVCEFRYNKKSPSVLKLDNSKLYETYENCGINLTDDLVDDTVGGESSKKDSSIHQTSL